MKKRVLHLLASNKYSGAENVACTIIDNDKEYEMFYCSKKGPIEEVLKSRNITYIPLKHLNPFEVKKICKKYKIDILHSHDMKAGFIAALSRFKGKIINTLHVNYTFNNKWTLYSFLYKMLIKKFDTIICVSNEVYEKAIFINDKNRNKFLVLPNVVDKKRINSKCNEFPTDKYDMIYVGRITEVKRPEWIVDITNNVIKKYPDFKVGIIGVGNLYENIKSSIQEKKLENNIEMLGFKSNPFPYIKNSKFAILPSIHEGLPMSVIECLILNKPVLNSGVDGLGTLFKDYPDFICNTKEEYSKKIIKLLTNDKYLRSECIKVIKDTTNMNKYIKKVNEVYEK